MVILVIYQQGLGIGVAEGVEKAIQSVLGRAGVGTTRSGPPGSAPGSGSAAAPRGWRAGRRYDNSLDGAVIEAAIRRRRRIRPLNWS